MHTCRKVGGKENAWRIRMRHYTSVWGGAVYCRVTYEASDWSRQGGWYLLDHWTDLSDNIGHSLNSGVVKGERENAGMSAKLQDWQPSRRDTVWTLLAAPIMPKNSAPLHLECHTATALQYLLTCIRCAAACCTSYYCKMSYCHLSITSGENIAVGPLERQRF